MDIGQRSEELVNVQFDFEYWHGGLHLVEVTGGSVDGFGDVFEDEVEVNFIFLMQLLAPIRHGSRLIHPPALHWSNRMP